MHRLLFRQCKIHRNNPPHPLTSHPYLPPGHIPVLHHPDKVEYGIPGRYLPAPPAPLLYKAFHTQWDVKYKPFPGTPYVHDFHPHKSHSDNLPALPTRSFRHAVAVSVLYDRKIRLHLLHDCLHGLSVLRSRPHKAEAWN